MLDQQAINDMADRVLAAQDNASAIAKLSNDYPDMSVDDGYAVQWELRRRWIARGQRPVGVKAGLTSKAKMEQMGVHVPGFGFLMSDFARPENGEIDTSALIHPRVEAEIAFVTRTALAGEHCTVEEVLAATDFVIPAVEVIDSRYQDFKFDLPSVIADNSSSARYVTGGRPMDPAGLDLPTI
ncbi:MAG: 2-keto-4-pentenoate hydratase, partial [Salinisphaera sp.]|nr:2-keto-4-pentenoate hydratase [Salinisphaera sp.]